LVELHPHEDIHGRDYAVVIIKGTFNPCGRGVGLTLSDDQVAVQHADKFYGEPGASSIQYGSDLSPVKKATDVILLGQGYAPGGHAVSQFDVSLQVGERQHSVRMFGDRHWYKDGLLWRMSRPEPFYRVALLYENAFGGRDPQAEQQGSRKDLFEPANPIGKGFISNNQKPVEGLALPNIEDPNALIQDIRSRPKPSGFGVIARDWQPRLGLAGTYDQAWQEERMPLLPLDFNPQFFNAAHPDLCFSPMLRGDEWVTVSNATESGLLSFQLPNLHLVVTANLKMQQADFVAQLDTVVIEPDENRVILTWRAAIPCKRKLLYLNSVTVKRRR